MKVKTKLEKLDWEDVILNVGKPVWDKKSKEWRVIVGYLYQQNTYYILFSDENDWQEFDKQNLYLKGE